jgi:hypothetical protein
MSVFIPALAGALAAGSNTKQALLLKSAACVKNRDSFPLHTGKARQRRHRAFRKSTFSPGTRD